MMLFTLVVRLAPELAIKSGNNKIKEVIEAFLGDNTLQYYQDSGCVSLYTNTNTVADKENKNSLQGKIALTSQAFFDGVAAGKIHIRFNCQKNQQWTIERFVEEDLAQALRDPKDKLADSGMPIQRLKKAMQGNALGDAQYLSDQDKFIAQVSRAIDDNLQMTKSTKVEPYAYQSAKDIIEKQKPQNEQVFLKLLAESLKLAPISLASKQERFINEALLGLFMIKKVNPIAKSDILDNLKLLFSNLDYLSYEKVEALRSLDLLNLIYQHNTPNASYFSEAMANVLANHNPKIPISTRQATPDEQDRIYCVFCLR